MKLLDTDLKVLDILWERGDTSAKEISDMLADKTGWNINTTYTVIKRCITKGAIERLDPGFICHALITRQQAQLEEATALMDRLYGGSAELLVASLVSNKKLSSEEIDRLSKLIDSYK